jgi:hypothetical protein
MIKETRMAIDTSAIPLCENKNSKKQSITLLGNFEQQSLQHFVALS